MMGPSLQQEASKFNVMDHAMFDVAGPITVKVSRNVTKKSYILTLTCIWSRYTLFTIMHDLSANSVLQALKTAAFNLGGTLPKHLYSDHETNLLPIRSIQDEEEVDLQSNEIREIVATLKKEKIELHLSSPSARYRVAQEVVKKLNVKIYIVDGTENDADIGSKLSLEKNYALEDWYWTSKWFFKDPSEWPCVRYEFKPAHLSFNIFNPRYLLCNAIGLQPSLLSEVIDKFRSFKKIHLILSYVMYWKHRDFQVALKMLKILFLFCHNPRNSKRRDLKSYTMFLMCQFKMVD